MSVDPAVRVAQANPPAAKINPPISPKAECRPGLCAPGATPPASPNEISRMDPKAAAARAQILIEKATDKDPMRSLLNLSDAYRKADPAAVKKAMLANPAFTKLTDGAAKTLINDVLKNPRRDDQTQLGDRAMHALYDVASHCDPAVAGALVVSATPLFVEHSKEMNGAIFTFDDRIHQPNPVGRNHHGDKTYIAGLNEIVGQENRHAVQAVNTLNSLVVGPPQL